MVESDRFKWWHVAVVSAVMAVVHLLLAGRALHNLDTPPGFAYLASAPPLDFPFYLYRSGWFRCLPTPCGAALHCW